MARGGKVREALTRWMFIFFARPKKTNQKSKLAKSRPDKGRPRYQKPEARSQKPEVRSQKSEVRKRREFPALLTPAWIPETPPFGRQIEAGGRKSIRPARNPFRQALRCSAPSKGGRRKAEGLFCMRRDVFAQNTGKKYPHFSENSTPALRKSNFPTVHGRLDEINRRFRGNSCRLGRGCPRVGAR